jgi:hypothetical protein
MHSASTHVLFLVVEGPLSPDFGDTLRQFKTTLASQDVSFADTVLRPGYEMSCFWHPDAFLEVRTTAIGTQP